MTGRPIIDLTGKTFGLQTVLRRAGTAPNGHPLWHVRCSCGSERSVRGHRLQSGKILACGCGPKGGRTHGLSRSKLYFVWSSMLQRCANPGDPAYRNYGGRGITVCSLWRDSFEAFHEDMAPGWKPHLEIDRIDNNAGYSKTNCRWTTRSENMRNTRRARKYNPDR
jgi:hypothetical protein